MEQEIILSNNKKIIVKEILYKEAFSDDNREKREKDGYMRTMIQLSTNMSEEDFDKLSMKDGIKIQKAYMELNEVDFQMPQVEPKNSTQT